MNISIQILIKKKYCNTYRNTFLNIAIYRDTKFPPNTQPYYFFAIFTQYMKSLLIFHDFDKTEIMKRIKFVYYTMTLSTSTMYH